MAVDMDCKEVDELREIVHDKVKSDEKSRISHQNKKLKNLIKSMQNKKKRIKQVINS